ncbi:MAG: hypothetical protein KDB07_09050, partial [Planctomycetes bacterium]|nr:hypothetical protein [Planctomycetota bacterium]
MKLTWLAAILGVLTLSGGLLAQKSDEVGIIYNESFQGSEEVAQAYAKARKIPSENILGIKTSVSEEVERWNYNDEIKAPVEAFLKKHEKIWALVTCYGVPLKVKETDRSDDKGPFDG